MDRIELAKRMGSTEQAKDWIWETRGAGVTWEVVYIGPGIGI